YTSCQYQHVSSSSLHRASASCRAGQMALQLRLPASGGSHASSLTMTIGIWSQRVNSTIGVFRARVCTGGGEGSALVVEQHRLDEGVDVQLLVDILEVGADGFVTDVKLLSDLLGRITALDEFEDLDLALGQLVEFGLARVMQRGVKGLQRPLGDGA